VSSRAIDADGRGRLQLMLAENEENIASKKVWGIATTLFRNLVLSMHVFLMPTFLSKQSFLSKAGISITELL